MNAILQPAAGGFHFRSVWISDLHLGTKHAQVELLLDFLRVTECDYLYLVGDLVDGWELKARWFWRDEYNVLFQKLLRKSRKHTRVFYLAGNHDEFLEPFVGLRFGRITLARQVVHVAADGRRYLVLHGHQADRLMPFNRLLERIGSRLYQRILDVNLRLNQVGRWLGLGHWSLAAYLKGKAKATVRRVTDYEQTITQMARKLGVQGVICGHIHRAEIKTIAGVRYLNCGDWVESCTALVEDFDGNLQLLNLHEHPLLHSRRGPGASDPGNCDTRDSRSGRSPGLWRGRWRRRRTALAGLFYRSHGAIADLPAQPELPVSGKSGS